MNIITPSKTYGLNSYLIVYKKIIIKIKSIFFFKIWELRNLSIWKYKDLYDIWWNVQRLKTNFSQFKSNLF